MLIFSRLVQCFFSTTLFSLLASDDDAVGLSARPKIHSPLIFLVFFLLSRIYYIILHCEMLIGCNLNLNFKRLWPVSGRVRVDVCLFGCVQKGIHLLLYYVYSIIYLRQYTTFICTFIKSYITFYLKVRKYSNL